MARTIAVRVGFTSPPALVERGRDDVVSLLDAAADILAAMRSQADGIGLTDSASSNLVTGGPGLGSVALGTAPLGA